MKKKLMVSLKNRSDFKILKVHIHSKQNYIY